MLMITRAGRTGMVCLLLWLAQGCASIPVEAPICVPLRPVLEDVSVSSQERLLIADAQALTSLAHNDAKLKSHVRLLEGVIELHDEPLGSCE